jgi:hypothetical protein
LVLVLCMYYAGELNEEYARRHFEESKNSDFKAIYYIDPPQTGRGSLYNGQLIAIKNLYNDDRFIL